MTCFTHDGNKLVHDTTRHAGKSMFRLLTCQGLLLIICLKYLQNKRVIHKCYVFQMLCASDAHNMSISGRSVIFGDISFFLGKPQLLGGFVSQAPSLGSVRARLHQTSKSIWSQRCDDVCDTVLIDHNRVTPKWVATPFWSNSICFHCGQ